MMTADMAPNSRVEPLVLLGVLGSGPMFGGEDVDIGLDALVRVVDGVIDEPAAVVGLAVEPVGREPCGQPRRQASMKRCIMNRSSITRATWMVASTANVQDGESRIRGCRIALTASSPLRPVPAPPPARRSSGRCRGSSSTHRARTPMITESSSEPSHSQTFTDSRPVKYAAGDAPELPTPGGERADAGPVSPACRPRRSSRPSRSTTATCRAHYPSRESG